MSTIPIPKIPKYIETAFYDVQVISTDEYIEQDIRSFIERWSGYDLLTCVHVLQHGQHEDRMVAAFAIGNTGSTWARDTLLPFLHDEDAGVRWAVALSLGEMREPLVLPALLEMLQEFLTHPKSYEAEYDWFDLQRMHVMSILGKWGNTSLIPVLRDMLERVWLIEYEGLGDREQNWWRDYQETLAYALGRLGAFDALKDMKLPEYRRRYWTIYIAMGYIDASVLGWNSVIGRMQDVVTSEEKQDLYKLLLQTLQQKIGLSLQEAELYIQSYDDDHASIRYSTPEERRRNDSMV